MTRHVDRSSSVYTPVRSVCCATSKQASKQSACAETKNIYRGIDLVQASGLEAERSAWYWRLVGGGRPV